MESREVDRGSAWLSLPSGFHFDPDSLVKAIKISPYETIDSVVRLSKSFLGNSVAASLEDFYN